MVFKTDEDLIREISQGNKSAFDQLFRNYYMALRHYAQRFVKDITQAEDIVQDVFFNIWIKREQIDNVKSIGAYIKTAVHNECISKLRKNLKTGIIAIDDIADFELENLYGEIFQYQDSVSSKELSIVIGRAIDDLPPQSRNVFILSRSFGFKNKEIAAHLNISVKAVEKHITKALSILREKLKDYLPFLLFFIFS